ncbi:hypothetical protein C480_01892 [Natrialba aegyptia DSM 13077]|uniref:Uncharacterized protein n=1 Tax=Natrialba aegyptia DSM 13077 TaxID=1227491 RepID=M0BID6_9EURY|nr:hypothetical protein C480_01892 [Natrialba aegyptia DSM 13077]
MGIEYPLGLRTDRVERLVEFTSDKGGVSSPSAQPKCSPDEPDRIYRSITRELDGDFSPSLHRNRDQPTYLAEDPDTVQREQTRKPNGSRFPEP